MRYESWEDFAAKKPKDAKHFEEVAGDAFVSMVMSKIESGLNVTKAMLERCRSIWRSKDREWPRSGERVKFVVTFSKLKEAKDDRTKKHLQFMIASPEDHAELMGHFLLPKGLHVEWEDRLEEARREREVVCGLLTGTVGWVSPDGRFGILDDVGTESVQLATPEEFKSSVLPNLAIEAGLEVAEEEEEEEEDEVVDLPENDDPIENPFLSEKHAFHPKGKDKAAVLASATTESTPSEPLTLRQRLTPSMKDWKTKALKAFKF